MSWSEFLLSLEELEDPLDDESLSSESDEL